MGVGKLALSPANHSFLDEFVGDVVAAGATGAVALRSSREYPETNPSAMFTLHVPSL